MIIIFVTNFSHFLGQMIKTYLMTIRATLIPKNKNHKLEQKKHTFDWLYSNYYYYYYIFSPVCDDVPYEVFWPQPFFYVEARDSKQKTQKNLKNDHPERNFWIFLY